jgi:hypothetical protein
VQAAVQIALARGFMPAVEALRQASEHEGGRLAREKGPAFWLYASYVHERVRTHRRFEMLKAAAKAGLPVEACGAGYQRDLYRFKNVTYRGEAGIAEVIAAMRRARVVLNVNANFGQGSHERPLTAMLAGAAAASDHSAFYDAAFRPDEIIQLRWRSLAGDLQALRARLDDVDALHQQAVAAHTRAAAEHRWDNRLDAIITAADAVRS